MLEVLVPPRAVRPILKRFASNKLATYVYTVYREMHNAIFVRPAHRPGASQVRYRPTAVPEI